MKHSKVALIGCGAAALRYYVPAFKKHKDLLDGLCLVDTDRKNAEIIQKELGGGQISGRYQEVLSRVDGAIILLPNHLHHAVVMDCLNAGVHVLCEKPLVDLPEHAREMINTAEKNGVALCVNNTRRMFPTFRTVNEAIHAGEFGRVMEIEYIEGNTFGWPSATGFYVNPKVSSKGILLDLGAHAIDTLCWWVGGKPDLDEFLDDSYDGPESVVKIRARKDGCRIKVTLNRLCELDNTYKIVCEKGTIEGGIFDWKRFTVMDTAGRVVERKLKCPSRNYPGFVFPIIDNFIDVLSGAQSPLVTGKDVLPSIDFIHECYEKRKSFDFSWDKTIDMTATAREKHDPMKERKILVTGATGFIGGRIVEMVHLSENRQYKVVAGIRQWASAARLGRLPVDIVTMDLMDRNQIDRALEDITHIIHCAKGTPEATVEGTRNLLEISMKKGIQHFIHLSTAEVYGDATGVVDESFPFHYTGNAYNRMKIDAEKACWEYQGKGLPITIFRPSIVYGPYSTNWCLRFASMFLAGEWGIYEKYGEGKCNLVFIDDLVQTIIHALDEETVYGKALNINGPETITWNEYFVRLNDGMGLPALRKIQSKSADMATYAMEPVRIMGGFVKKHLLKPVKLLAESIDIVDAMMRKVEHKVKITPGSEELRLFAKNVIYSDALARELLSYCPETQLDQGMKESIDWLRFMGKL